MLRTPLCDLLGIDVPVIGAPFGPWDQVDLAAAVSEAGGLGSVGSVMRSVPELRRQWEGLRARTDRPFAINHTGRPFDPAVLDAQVKRMLADKKSDQFVVNFAGQWLNLRAMQTAFPIPGLYPDWDDNLRAAMRKETELFVGAVVHEDRSVIDLLAYATLTCGMPLPRAPGR